MAERDLAEWDREIEADFQRAVSKTKSAGRAKRGRRLVGAPIAFVADVCQRTEGRTALVVALLLYRRTRVCKSQTVTLPRAELANLGVSQRSNRKALARLKAASVIQTDTAKGRSTKVTLLWRDE
jgi:hypothetical protein